MVTLLVELKNEYTSQIVNILSPLIFQGIQSIYAEAQAIVKVNGDRNNTLKIFQSCLKRIPKWNTAMIEKETNRIINSSHSYGWLNDLIKATLKANLIVLMYNPTLRVQNKLDPSFYQNIKTVDFIHRVYIECARELWNNPYLLYHHFPPIEIKRNQRDCMNLIKDCIKEALRKLLPVKHVLQFYLGEDIDKLYESSHLVTPNIVCLSSNLEKPDSHSSFDDFLKRIQPDIVLFDRFIMEEQFGWRVAEICPGIEEKGSTTIWYPGTYRLIFSTIFLASSFIASKLQESTFIWIVVRIITGGSAGFKTNIDFAKLLPVKS